jgi:hypothetical protein
MPAKSKKDALMKARYDGFADWYDDWNAPNSARNASELLDLLGPGRLFFYGAHPCFNGPHVEWMDDGGVRAHPTYRVAGWHQEAPWWGHNIRRRFGMRHHPLADFLNAFTAAGLVIEHVEEAGDRPVPSILAVRSLRPAPGTR